MSAAPIPTVERPPPWLAAVGTIVMTALTVLAARAAERALDPQSLSLFFVVPIVVAAIQFGLWSSLAAAVMSTLALNYFFVEPRYTFDVAREQDGAALLLFAVVSLAVSVVAAQARQQTLRARLREWEALVLGDFVQRLSGSIDNDLVAAAATAAMSELAQAPAALVAADDRCWGTPLDGPARESAKWAMSVKQPYLPTPDAAVDTSWSFWPIISAGRVFAALGARAALPSGRAMAASHLAAQAGAAFERARVEELAAQARRDAEREKLKSELLAGVSHDLRTPLSTIVFTLQSLRHFNAEHSPDARDELLSLAENEARRLAGFVDALLDASRLEAGASPVRAEAVSLADVIERALSVADIGAARVDLNLSDDLPRLRADPVLAARAIANILENAVRHGVAPVRLDARARDGNVVVEISDAGAGLGGDPERLFEKFVRGAAGDGRAPGLGLGLPIARSLIESQGGALSAYDRDEGGAVFRITLPVADDD